MFKIIEFLLEGCWHKWELVSKEPVDYVSEFRDFRTYVVYHKCGKCNKVKRKVIL